MEPQDKKAKSKTERTELINSILEGSIETPGEFLRQPSVKGKDKEIDDKEEENKEEEEFLT